MANERLNIPETLKVGFNSRSDTYSGKLAYVTYINKKGDYIDPAGFQPSL